MRTKGFSLAEILISVVILGIIIVSMATFFTRGFISIKKNSAIMPAVNLTNQQIEKMRKMPYTDIIHFYGPPTREFNVFRNGLPYKVYITTNMIYSGFADVTIEIKWEAPGEQGKRNIITQTYIYNL